MPKRAKELSAVEVRRLGTGVHAVGGVAGLMLQTTPSGGGQSWLLRTKIGTKRREIGLGPFPEVTLANARVKAAEMRELIRQGVDPVEQRKAARAALVAQQQRGLSFADAVEKYLDAKLDEFNNQKHAKQWRSTLNTYANPMIGKMLVADIEMQDVLRVLEPIWLAKTETAKRLRGRIESVLSWATVAGHRTGDNPARWKGNLSEILPKPTKVAKTGNQPALQLDDAPRWFAELQKREGTATRALELTALCAVRSGEVRGATWDEFDLEKAIWIIPATRMKMVREHRVPLTPDAVSLLRTLPRMADSPYVFPAARGGMLSDMSLSAVMRRIQEAEVKAERVGYLDRTSKRPAVPHGLRSTFRDWAAERTEYPRELAEISLAHSVGSDVERAYQRSDMLDRRRSVMAAWGRFLTGEVEQKVVHLEARC